MGAVYITLVDSDDPEMGARMVTLYHAFEAAVTASEADYTDTEVHALRTAIVQAVAMLDMAALGIPVPPSPWLSALADSIRQAEAADGVTW